MAEKQTHPFNIFQICWIYLLNPAGTGPVGGSEWVDGDWTDLQSITFKVDQSGFQLPVEFCFFFLVLDSSSF